MKNPNKIIYTLLGCFLAIYGAFGQTQWPVTPFNSQHNIAGSIGEYRSTNRFHRGSDITGNDLKVYAINSGRITQIYYTGHCDDSYVLIGTVYYYHIISLPSLEVGSPINVGDQIGTMFSTPRPGNSPCPLHVHLQDNNINFLAGQLFPYEDRTIPIIHDYSFRRNLENNQLNTRTHNNSAYSNNVLINNVSHTILYNKVDLIVSVSDPGIGPNGTANTHTIAPYSITYDIKDANNRSLDGISDNITFQILPINTAAPTVFGFGTTFSPAVFYYNLTSHPRTTPYDRFWNTGLREGQNEDWNISTTRNPALDARINEEAHYPEGKYTVELSAFDVDYNDNPNNRSLPDPRVVNAVIDNFLPYVKKVEVIARHILSTVDRTVYAAEWLWSSANSTFSLSPGNQSQRIIDAINPSNENVHMVITFSEPMQSTGMTVNIKAQDGSLTATANLTSTNTDNTEFTWSVPSASIASVSGMQNIEIRAQDYAGNSLIGYSEKQIQYSSSDIPKRQQDGTFAGSSLTPTGIIDVVHHFQIMECGLRKTGICFITDFVTGGSSTIAAGEPVSFIDNTIGAPTSWNWDFGDGGTSTLQNPSHTYTIPGTYTVKLKSANSLGSGEKTKTNYITITGTGAALAVDFSGTPTTIAAGSSVNYTNQSSGGKGNLSYDWSFQGGNPATSTSVNPQNINYANPGVYNVSLTVTDGVGNVTKTKSNYITVNPFSLPLTADFTYSPSAPNAGTPVYLCVGTVNGGTAPYTYVWDFGDPASGTLNTSSNNCDMHVFSTAGTYFVQLRVKDANANVYTANQTLYVSSPSAITADFTANLTVTSVPNNAITFSASASSLSAGTLTYKWTFTETSGQSNPITATGATPTVILPVGTYNVTLVISNTFSSKTITKNSYVTVNANNTPLTVSSGFSEYNCDNNDPPFLLAPWVDGGVKGNTRYTSLNAPNPGEDYYYKFYWGSPNSGVSFTHPTQPNTFINVENYAWPSSSPSFSFTANLRIEDYRFQNYQSIVLSRTVTLYRDLSLAPLSDVNLCPGATAVIAPVASGGTGAGTYKYSWSPTTGLSCTDCANPVITAPSSTITYTLSLEDKRYSCSSSYTPKATFKVSGNPVIANAGPDKNVCINSTTTIGSVASGGSGNYKYEWSPATGLSCTDCATPTVTPLNMGSVTYTVKVSDANGGTGASCFSSDQVIVTVGNTFPVAQVCDDINSCPGKLVYITGSGSGASESYTLNFSDGTTNYGGEVLNNKDLSSPVSPWATTEYIFTVTDASGCSDEARVKVFVDQNLAPVVSAGSDKTACAEGAVLSGSTSGGTPGYTYVWSNGGNTPSTTVPNTDATYTLTVADANGCKGTDDVHVSKGTPIELVGNYLVKYACAGQSVRLGYDGNDIPQQNSPYTYLWSPATGLDDPTLEFPTATVSSTSFYTLKITDANGCTKNIKGLGMVMITNQSDPDFSVNDQLCSGYPICLNKNPNVTGSGVNSFDPSESNWAFDPTATISTTITSVPDYSDMDNDGCLTYDTPGQKTITYTVTSNTCGTRSVTKTIDVNESMEVLQTDQVCGNISGTTSPLNDRKAQDIKVSISCNTDILPGAVSTFEAGNEIVFNPGFTAQAGSDFTASIKPCFTTHNLYKTTPNTTIEGTLNENSAYGGLPVVNDSIELLDSNNAVVSTVSPAATDTSGSFSFNINQLNALDNSALYTLATTSGAVLDSIGFQNIYLWEYKSPLKLTLKKVQAEFVSDTVKCFADSVHFISTTNGGKPPYIYHWDFGNGATSSSAQAQVKYSSPGTYTTTLIATDARGYVDTIIRQIIIPECPTLNGSLYENPACSGNPVINDTLVLLDTNMNIVNSVTFAISDTSGNFSFDYNELATLDTSALFTVSIKNGTAIDSIGYKTINNWINQSPLSLTLKKVQAGFATELRCFADSVHFISTVNAGIAPYSYYWDFGNGITTSYEQAQIKYFTPGTYTIHLTVTDAKGCRDTKMQRIIVPDCPGINGNLYSCGVQPLDNDTLVLLDASMNRVAIVSSAITDVYGGFRFKYYELAALDTSALFTIAINNGTALDSLSFNTINNWTNQSPLNLTLRKVQADYSASTINCFADSVHLVSTTSGGRTPYTYYWDFGNGVGSSDIQAAIKYAVSGSYVVTLIATDVFGCSDTATQALFVPEVLAGTIAGFTDVTCSGNDGSINLFVTGGTPPYTYSWSNGITTEDLSNLTAGSYSVTVSDAMGCSATAAQQLIAPNCLFVSGTVTQSIDCGGYVIGNESIVLLDTALNPVAYSMTDANGNFSFDYSQLSLLDTAGQYLVSLPAHGIYALQDTVFKSISELSRQSPLQLNLKPITVSYTYSPIYCYADSVHFTANVSGGNSPYYFWDFGNGDYADNVLNPVEKYNWPGIYDVTFMAWDNSGCYSSYSQPLFIDDCPLLPIFGTLTGSPDCGGMPVSYTSLTVVDTAYNILQTVYPAMTDVDGIFYFDPYSFSTLSPGELITFAAEDGTPLDSTNFKTIAEWSNQSPVQLVLKPITVSYTYAPIRCFEDSIYFTANVSGGTSPVYYFWNFGNGNYANDVLNPVEKYDWPGIYDVTFEAWDNSGCYTSYTQTLTIPECPVVLPIFGYLTEDMSCGGFPAMDDTLVLADVNGNRIWEVDPAITAADGSFMMDLSRLTMTDTATLYRIDVLGNVKLQDTTARTISEWQQLSPVVLSLSTIRVDFTYNAISCFDDTVYYTANIQGGMEPYTYQWDFGNGEVSSLSNPAVKYASFGSYNVSLSLSEAMGCNVVVSQQVNIPDCPFTTNLPVTGTLYGNALCGGFPEYNDTLVILDADRNPTNVMAITQAGGDFSFNPADLSTLYATTNYYITTKSGFGVEDTAARTISDWISQSPLSLTLAPAKLDWAAHYNSPDSLYCSGTAVDAHGCLVVIGSVSSQANSSDMVTLHYNTDGVLEWSAVYNGTGNSADNAVALAIDSKCNVYVAGYSGSPAGQFDYITIKYDSMGVQQWVRRYNSGSGSSYAYDLKLDSNGDVYVTGGSRGQKSDDCVTIKYTPDGTEQWVARYTTTSTSYYSSGTTAMAIDSLNNIYITGAISDVTGYYSSDYLTIKYNSSGVQQWVARYNAGIGVDYGSAIVTDKLGHVVVTGTSYLTTYYGSESDYVTLQYDAATGAPLWVARYNSAISPSKDQAHAIATDDAGNVYVTGDIAGNAPNYSDYGTVKYDVLGQEQWVTRYNGTGNSYDMARDMTADAAGNVYVTGYSNFTGESTNYVTVKYNTDGVQQWVESFNGKGNAYDDAFALAIDKVNNVYVTGRSNNVGNTLDMTTIKISQCQGQDAAPVMFKWGGSAANEEVPKESISDKSTSNIVNVYPNPNNGSMQIDYVLPEEQEAEFAIFDLVGKKIKSYSLKGGKNTFFINDIELQSGVYVYQVTSNKQRIKQDKLVIIR